MTARIARLSYCPRRRRGGAVKKVLLALVVLIAAFLIYVALQPADYRVERKTTINAPPDVVFAQVNDFHKWEAWSPWAKRDPNAKNSYEGASAGKGAIFRWSGNDEVGEGSMTLTDSQPPKSIRIDLAFVRPMEDQAQVEFAFTPAGDQTEVTWTMSGHNNFVGKLFCVFMNMDKMVGADFEAGLASLKTVAEAARGK